MLTTALVTAILAGLIPSVIAAPAEAMTSSIVVKFGADLTADNHYGSPIPPWHSGGKPGWYYGGHPDDHPDLPCLTPDNCKWLGQYPSAIHCPHTYPPPPHHHNPPPPPPHHDPHHPPPHHPPPPHHTKPTHTVPPYTTTTPPPDTTTTPPPDTTSTTPPYTTSPPPPPPPPPSDGYDQTFYDITAAVQADDYMTFGLVDTVEDCKAMCDSVEGCGFVNTYHDVNGKDGSPLLTCALFSLCHGAEDADNRGGQSQPDGSINYITDSDGWCKSTPY